MKPIVSLPVRTEWKEKMESGEKTCISRILKAGHGGQCFMGWGKVYVILWVEVRDLDDVAANLFQEEGWSSPEEFIQDWVHRHPLKGWTPKLQVFVHHFMLLEAWERKYGR